MGTNAVPTETSRSSPPRPVTHAGQAEDLFSTLMGDVVDPRREFIQSHALEVANLDV
jgi:DNA gyrase subunit B